MNADLLSAYQLLNRYDLSKQRIYINGVANVCGWRLPGGSRTE